MTFGETRTARREALGLAVADIERWSALPFYEDLEHNDRRALEHTPVSALRTIAGSLHLELFSLLELRCAFCDEGRVYDSSYARATRAEIIHRAREANGLSPSGFADRLSIVNWAAEALEADHAYLEICNLAFVELVARTLSIPVQVLLNPRCPSLLAVTCRPTRRCSGPASPAADRPGR